MTCRSRLRQRNQGSCHAGTTRKDVRSAARDVLRNRSMFIQKALVNDDLKEWLMRLLLGCVVTES